MESGLQRGKKGRTDNDQEAIVLVKARIIKLTGAG